MKHTNAYTCTCIFDYLSSSFSSFRLKTNVLGIFDLCRVLRLFTAIKKKINYYLIPVNKVFIYLPYLARLN